MPVEGDYQVDIWHKTAGVWGSLSYSIALADASRFMNYEWGFNENRSKTLKVTLSNGDLGTYNLLDSTFNAWSNGVIGAVDNGDIVAFALCPTGQLSLQYVFYGIVTDVQPDIGTRTLTLVCNDELIRYEDFKSDKVVFAKYRDRYPLQVAYGVTNVTMTLPDSMPALPLVKVELFTTSLSKDSANPPGEVPNSDSQSLNTGPVAIPFIAQDDYLLSAAIYIKGDGTATDFVVGVQNDYGGVPDGTWVAYCATQTITYGGGYTFFPVLLDGAAQGVPVKINKGVLYWLVVQKLTGAGNSYVGVEDVPSYTDGVASYYEYWSSAAWHTQNGKTLNVKMNYGNFKVIPASDYTYDLSTWIITINKLPQMHDTGLYASVPNSYALVSYYYNKVTAAAIATALTSLDGPLFTDIAQTFVQSSTYLNAKTFPIFRTKGNFVADCMRELCDNYCVTAAGVAYQAVVAPYNTLNTPAGTNNLKWSRRLILTDASFRTFSTDPTSLDDQLRIVDASGLRKTSKRPASVLVIGQDSSGKPIVAHRDDWMNDQHTAGTSFRNKSGRLLTDTVTDTSINTLQQANELAQAREDMVVRDQWEGEIVLDGCMPDLADIDPASLTYGSGKIVTLRIPEGGIFTQKFKVRGITLTPFETRVQLTNYPILVANNFTAAYLSAKKSEAFLAPTEADVNVFMKVAVPGAVTAATAYMALQTTSPTTTITATRVLCTRLADPTRHTVYYHAEFEAGNGVTTDIPASWVGKASLYDASTGGTILAIGRLGAGYEFSKWSGTRVIVDFACWDGT